MARVPIKTRYARMYWSIYETVIVLTNNGMRTDLEALYKAWRDGLDVLSSTIQKGSCSPIEQVINTPARCKTSSSSRRKKMKCQHAVYVECENCGSFVVYNRQGVQLVADTVTCQFCMHEPFTEEGKKFVESTTILPVIKEVK